MNATRLTALVLKEAKQLLRDPYSILLGILLPVVLLLICGYGMSTDIRNIRLTIVVPERSEDASKIVARFDASDYFDVRVVHDTAAAEDRYGGRNRRLATRRQPHVPADHGRRADRAA